MSLIISPLFLCRKAQSLQFTNSLKVKSLNCDLQAVKKTEPQNVTRKAAAEEATDQGPRAIPTKKDDKAQVSLTYPEWAESHRQGGEGKECLHKWSHALEAQIPPTLKVLPFTLYWNRGRGFFFFFNLVLHE